MSDLQDIEARARQIEERLFAEMQGIAEILAVPKGPDTAALELRMGDVQPLVNSLGKLSKQYQRQAPPDARAAADRHRGRYFRRVRHRLRKWRDARSAVMQAIALKAEPLHQVTGPPRILSQLDVIDQVYKSMYTLLRADAQSAASVEQEHYPDIPLGISRLASYYHAALRVCMAQERERPLRFLDVGCGVGLTLLTAARMFERVSGLEFDPAYAAAARDLHRSAGSTSVDIIEGDALRFDDYGEFDVIYFFKPIQQTDKMRALEQRIIAGARKGTVLIAPYQDFRSQGAALQCAHIARCVYVAGMDEAEARALGQAAERIGSAFAAPGAEADRHAGFLGPLIDALARRGVTLGEDVWEI